MLSKFDSQVIGTHFLGRVVNGAKLINEVVVYFLLILLCNLDYVQLVFFVFFRCFTANVYAAQLWVFTFFVFHYQKNASFPSSRYLWVLIHLVGDVFCRIHKLNFFLAWRAVEIGPKAVSSGSCE